MDEVFRQEKKFMVTVEEQKKYGHLLDEVLMQDAHNGTEGYVIRSLYFDTLDDRDFHEKEDGVEVRRKIRLRIYDPGASYASLEMKQKQGMYQRKRSLRIRREDAKRLIEGDYSVLLKDSSDFAAECYGLMNMQCYRPRAIVQYRRKAYIAKENKIRVTFDSKIEATETNFDLFSDHLNLYSVWDPFLSVLEVKYNGFLLSYIRDIINRIDKSEVSVGKYSLSRSVGLKYIFY